MKKFILGFLVGALLFSIMPVSAAIQEYVLYKSDCSLVVDGQAYTEDQELPMLNYKGYNYIPVAVFRKVAEQFGMNFNWNGELKQVEIRKSSSAEAHVQVSEKEGNGLSETTEKITQTPDGITNIDTWEGKQYIGFLYIRNKIREKGYDFANVYIRETKTHKWRIIKGEYELGKTEDYETILDDVPTTIVYGASCVEIDYYIDTILPLIK